MSTSPASGRFVLRTGEALHAKLRLMASKAGISLNELCNQILSAAVSIRPTSKSEVVSPFGALIKALRAEFDQELIGVVLFGSAARNEMTSSSDIDLLIVTTAAVSRAIYRRWDDSKPITESLVRFDRTVNPQFVSLPSAVDSAGSIWLEAAVEGQILWDLDNKAHAFLVRLRKAIADGRFVRHQSYGHPYWSHRKVS